MKGIKLRRINQTKSCPGCGMMVKIEMRGTAGYCPECKEKLYDLDWRPERERNKRGKDEHIAK